MITSGRCGGSVAWRRPRQIFAVIIMLTANCLAASDVSDAEAKLLAGDYERAIKAAEAGVRDAPGNAEWAILLGSGLLKVGRYREAHEVMTLARGRDVQNIRLQWLAREAALGVGLTEQAQQRVEDIRRMVSNRPWAYRDAASLVVFGRLALALGADPREVLDKLYATALKELPEFRDAYLAKGELALEKHDFALAGAAFQEALKKFPEDADFHYGLARAYENGDRATMLAAVSDALKFNPRHVPSLLLLADHRIDAEDYAAATELLERIKAINPWHPEAWAYRAVIAHLRSDVAGEKTARETALHFWPTNPRVDYLIGQKFAQKYRFSEAAEAQRRALQFDPAYRPAKSELATNLLRLGHEEEGWKLARAVHAEDGYDVEAFNLATLHDTMMKYATLRDDDFVLRMPSHEAAVYGARALALLKRAKAQLTEKYGIEIARPTYVDIFGDPKDFAVRTFGMPDVAGFLGVCFGRVVTANSPSANGGHPTNWESVLWHEFCHVVTLQSTDNKMPRWLSEGISVYEERQASPSWGMRMNPRNREMLLTELTPVSRLSAAFLAPKTPEHLEFAYFESSLVVEFLIERFGLESLKAVLRDLREGVPINDAIAARTAPMETVERDFAAFAKSQAERLAPDLDWEKPDPKLLTMSAETGLPQGSENPLPMIRRVPMDAEAALAQWAEERPNNYWALNVRVRRLVSERKWAEAKPLLRRLIQLYPRDTTPGSGYRMLSIVHRALGEKEEERRALAAVAELEGDLPDTYLRLMELAKEKEDWRTVAKNADRFLQVNPLVAPPYRYLAEASAALGDSKTAITAYRTLLLLDPANPADIHFHLARLLHDARDPDARIHALKALEDAPRYRAALKLLLEINEPPTAEAGSDSNRKS